MADKALSAALPARNTTAPTNPADESNRDACLLKAFALWQSLQAERRALPDTGNYDDADKLFTVEERAVWEKIDRAETEVHDLPATTPAGVACKLWIAIPHNTTDQEPEAAAFRADLGWFVAQRDAIDWNLRCIISALVALKLMEAGA